MENIVCMRGKRLDVSISEQEKVKIKDVDCIWFYHLISTNSQTIISPTKLKVCKSIFKENNIIPCNYS